MVCAKTAGKALSTDQRRDKIKIVALRAVGSVGNLARAKDPVRDSSPNRWGSSFAGKTNKTLREGAAIHVIDGYGVGVVLEKARLYDF